MTPSILHYSTVSPLLKTILKQLMSEPLFAPFRLVGGTNLSLRFGHRISDDIDLFTDAEYGSLDFDVLENYLKKRFKYYDCPDKSNIVGFGRSYYVGDHMDSCIKLDLMYTDPFISKEDFIDGIRFAGINDIVAMKLTAINNGGRKKDFWDIHLLLDHYNLKEMLDLYQERHPWEGTKEHLLEKLIDFEDINYDFEPRCLLGKDWDIIKLDIIEKVRNVKTSLNIP